MQVNIVMSVIQSTSNVTLHAVDMDIDQSFTSLWEYPVVLNSSKIIKIIQQYNDTLRQFHVIRLAKSLKAGKQYILNIKYVGRLNDYLQGFYRSSYVVNNETRFVDFNEFII
jgi:aminopeptidase N